LKFEGSSLARSDSSRPPAFTLIEVLLAVVVFSIVLVAIHTVFHSALRLRNKATQAIEATLPLQQSLAIIKRDLANLVAPGGTLFGELQTTPTGSTQSGPSQSSQLGSFNPSAASLQGMASPAFYTSVGLLSDAAPWGEVEKVSYFLADATNHAVGRDLVRSVTRNLLPTLQEQPSEQLLMSGVDRLFFSFYDGTQWREDWDSTTATTKLPLAIKVELELAVEETDPSPPPPIQLVVPLMVQGRTNQTAQATGGPP
jgi:prepilin-type N-terminal cleavage/methylation domain-containing protein